MPGHSGHNENEACDTACTWAISEAPAHFRALGEGKKVELEAYSDIRDWAVLDGREFIVSARKWSTGDDIAQTISLLEQKLKYSGIKDLKIGSPKPKQKKQTDLFPEDSIEEYLEPLSDLCDKAKREKSESAKTKSLVKDLEKLIKKHSS